MSLGKGATAAPFFVCMFMHFRRVFPTMTQASEQTPRAPHGPMSEFQRLPYRILTQP